MCRNTPTITSVRLAADPHAAKAKGEQHERDGEASIDEPGLVMRTLVQRLRLRDGPFHPYLFLYQDDGAPNPAKDTSSAGCIVSYS